MKTLHEKAIHLAKQYLSSEKELLHVLIEMKEKKEFSPFGYTGIFSYCMGALGFSESQASYFSQVAEKSKEVPALKEAIDKGVLTVSKARRIVKVITEQTKDIWIERARTLPQRELERQVALLNPSAVQERMRAVDWDRHEVKLGLSGKAREKLERAIALLSKKRGKVCSMEETLEALVDSYLEKQDPVKKAERTLLRKVKPTKPTAGRRIPAFINRQVLLRDQGKCREPGCSNQTWTEIHHKIPYSQGGQHTPDNLITLCSAHHSMIHRE